MPDCSGAIAILLLAVAIIYLFTGWLAPARRHREGFTSPRAQEVCRASRALFDQAAGTVTYTEYKAALGGGVDPVLYTDVRRLWREGRLTPEAVQDCI